MVKKILVIFLAILLLACLTACDEGGQSTTQTTAATTTATITVASTTPETTVEQETQTTSVSDEGVYSFLFEGVEIIPGAAFEADVLPEVAFVYEMPSCAIEGTDNVYNYEVIEITAFNDGSSEIIYSVYITDANTSTPEGLYIGDDVSRVTELYGTDCTVEGTQMVYQRGKTMLVIILENDFVASIEYRMAG